MEYRANGRKIHRPFHIRDFAVPLPATPTSEAENIAGKLLIPETASPARPVPVVICSHFLNGTYRDSYEWAAPFAHEGYAGVVFDFRGGGRSSASSGSPTDMSVKTETEDLLAVIDAVSAMDFVNANMIFLCGQSQGGLVSALAAARKPEAVRALMLLYPAFSIPDATRARFSSPQEFPKEEMLMGLTVGRRYYEDVWEMDAYALSSGFRKSVVIYHGDGDTIVDISSAHKAADTYENATLHTVKGAGHSFMGLLQEQIAGELVDFVAVECGEKTRAERERESPSEKIWFGLGRRSMRKLWE